MMKNLLNIFNSETIRYVFIGGCTTVFNFVVFAIFYNFLSLSLNLSNFIAISLSIVFAFVTNKFIVFMDKSLDFKTTLKEFLKFVSGRIITMIVEIVGVWFLVEVLRLNEYFSKLIFQVVILVLNYIISKFFVFKKTYQNYDEMYSKIYKILGNETPLKCDCGVVCGKACCKGDGNIGMRLFPYEKSTLKNIGDGLVVCDGTCNRNERPLACRIFPFFPTIDEKGRIFVEPDYRAKRLCPLIEHSDEIVFNPKFFKRLKQVGKILAKNEKCRDFLYESTQEIDTYYNFLEK